MIVLVCGGRWFGRDSEGKPDELVKREIESFVDVMMELHDRHGFTEVIDGGAPGADSLAHDWATYMGIKSTRVFADWDRHGKAAGPIRNREMLKLKPQLVVAFPGGRGTEDMINIASKAGIQVFVSKPSQDHASIL
jgi:hypothetical protein